MDCSERDELRAARAEAVRRERVRAANRERRAVAFRRLKQQQAEEGIYLSGETYESKLKVLEDTGSFS